MKHQVIIALGTNVSEKNIHEAQTILRNVFSDLFFSQIIQTEPIGERFQNTMFYNALAAGTIGDILPSELVNILKTIECECGDNDTLREKGTVTTDIDLLKYDDLIFHEADWNRPYIKELTKEIAPIIQINI